MNKYFFAGLIAVALAAPTYADLWQDLAAYEYGAETKAGEALEALVKETPPDQYAGIEKKLIEIVASPQATSAGKQWSCRMLQRIGTGACVPALSGLLHDEILSHYARLTLERMPDNPAAGDALLKALSGAPPAVVPGLVYSLGERREAGAVKPLAALVGGGDAKAAAAALLALGKIGNAGALQALSGAKVPSALESGRLEALVACAARAGDAATLQKLAEGGGNDVIRAAALSAWAGVAPGPAAASMAKILAGGDSLLKQAATRMVVSAQGAEVTRALLASLDTLDGPTRARVVALFGQRGDRAVLAQVRGYLASDDAALRLAAIETIGSLGGAEEAPLLLDRMAAGDEDALKALSRIAAPGVDEVLVSALGHAARRAPAAKALALRGARTAVPELLKLLQSPDADTRAAAWDAVAQLASAEHIDALLGILISTKDPREQGLARNALKRVCAEATDREAASETLVRYYEKSAPEVQRLILELAAAIGTTKALDVERLALKSTDEETRRAALRALTSWPNAEAAPDLLALAKSGTSDAVTILAIRGYLDVAEKARTERERLKMFEEVTPMLARPDEKRLLVSKLRNVKSKECLVALTAYLADPDVRAEAEIALADLAMDMRKKNAKEAAAAAAKLVETSQNKAVLKKARQVLDGAK